jgi:hypothetical protein
MTHSVPMSKMRTDLERSDTERRRQMSAEFDDPAVCKCRHPKWQHQNGDCLWSGPGGKSCPCREYRPALKVPANGPGSLLAARSLEKR